MRIGIISKNTVTLQIMEQPYLNLAVPKYCDTVLPNYQDYKYYLQPKDGTKERADLENGKNGVNHLPQTQRKLSGMCSLLYG